MSDEEIQEDSPNMTTDPQDSGPQDFSDLFPEDPDDFTDENPFAEDIEEITFATREQIMEILKDVVDPELGVNIVDLGLVYGVDITNEGRATIDMTLTSPTCPLTDQLEADVYYLLSTCTRSAVINWVWMPPWTLDMISDDGREQLRAIGFNL
jgi:metal-sulfur cluster biosynthetic enzyme